MRMAYSGSHASVDVPALGRTVTRDEPIDIEDRRLARTLKRQGWRVVENEKNKERDGDA